MAEYNHPVRKKTILDDPKLKLYAAPVEGSTRAPALSWGVGERGNPRITVYTNDPNASKDNATIQAKFDMPNFFVFLNQFEDVISGTGKSMEGMRNSGHTFFGGKRSERPETLSTALVGREDSGKIFIQVGTRNSPRIKFYLMPSNWHHLIDHAGNALSEERASTLMARGYLDTLRMVIPQMALAGYQPPEPKDNGNRGGGNGNRNGGGNGGGRGQDYGNSGNDGFDDDIPF